MTDPWTIVTINRFTPGTWRQTLGDVEIDVELDREGACIGLCVRADRELKAFDFRRLKWATILVAASALSRTNA